jgi:hypothetical protein
VNIWMLTSSAGPEGNRLYAEPEGFEGFFAVCVRDELAAAAVASHDAFGGEDLVPIATTLHMALAHARARGRDGVFFPDTGEVIFANGQAPLSAGPRLDVRARSV